MTAVPIITVVHFDHGRILFAHSLARDLRPLRDLHGALGQL
jgi:hypothetical protein